MDPRRPPGQLPPSASAAPAAKPLDEYNMYLRTLQTRARDISHSISRLHLRERAPNWPRLLSQFSAIASQMQALYDELLTSERSWPARQHAAASLFHPLSPQYNPSSSLRVKPVLELETLEQSCFSAFLADANLSDISAADLRDEINEFNEAAIKLARWSQQANALPLPKDPGGVAAAAAGVNVTAAVSSAAMPASAAHAATAARRLAEERAEEAELQRSLAAMFCGRQTKPQTAHDPFPQPSLPQHSLTHSHQPQLHSHTHAPMHELQPPRTVQPLPPYPQQQQSVSPSHQLQQQQQQHLPQAQLQHLQSLQQQKPPQSLQQQLQQQQQQPQPQQYYHSSPHAYGGHQ
jgi:hypothetical protein